MKIMNDVMTTCSESSDGLLIAVEISSYTGTICASRQPRLRARDEERNMKEKTKGGFRNEGRMSDE